MKKRTETAMRVHTPVSVNITIFVAFLRL